MKSDLLYLNHVYECIRRIEENTAGGKKVFLESHTIQDAVIRNIQTMSEATQKLSDFLKDTVPEINWREISAFRNVLVHNYLGLDIEQIWEIVQNDIPRLKIVISQWLEND